MTPIPDATPAPTEPPTTTPTTEALPAPEVSSAPAAGAEESATASLLDNPLFVPAAVLGGTILAGLAAGRVIAAGREPGLAELLAGRRPPPLCLPEPPPPAPPPVRYLTHATAVTERPERVTYAWCHRFYYMTTARERRRIVPSVSSRSQYCRIATAIFSNWGEELDRRGTSFQRLRWIAGEPDFAKRQQRYLRVLEGTVPEELKKRPRRRLGSKSSIAERPAKERVDGGVHQERAADDAPRCPLCGAPRPADAGEHENVSRLTVVARQGSTA